MDTPLRWGSRQVPGTVAESSEGQSVPASSPNRLMQTSPIAAGMSEIDLSSPLNYGTPSSLGSIRTPRSGIRGTPARQRPDIRSEKRLRQVNLTEPVSFENHYLNISWLYFLRTKNERTTNITILLSFIRCPKKQFQEHPKVRTQARS